MSLAHTDINSTLNHFSKIKLEEMVSASLMDRMETKFILSQKQLIEVLNQIKNDYKVVDIDGNLVPQYKTVYFDTKDLYFYHEHHRQRSERYKVRFRNYVDSNLTFLEVKRKKNGRVEKQRIRVDNEQFLLNEEDIRFLKSVNIDQKDLGIKLTNTYDRITLVSKHSPERVTLDLNVKFSAENREESMGKVVIIELKQLKLNRETPVFKALRALQIKPFNVSKYCIGLIKTLGEHQIKYNRFKHKLLRIKKINQL